MKDRTREQMEKDAQVERYFYGDNTVKFDYCRFYKAEMPMQLIDAGPGIGMDWVPVFPYSTSLEYAMKIIEDMKARGDVQVRFVHAMANQLESAVKKTIFDDRNTLPVILHLMLFPMKSTGEPELAERIVDAVIEVCKP